MVRRSAPVLEGRVSATAAELTELIDCFLKFSGRARSSTPYIMDFKDIETSRLNMLLRDVATVNSEAADYFKFDSY